MLARGPGQCRHLAQAIGLCLDDVEYFLAESANKLFCVDRADAPDHAGGQVFLDAVDRRRRRGAHKARFELLAMGTVVDPFARCGDPLASRNGRGMANDVMSSRCPRALTRRTQKPFSSLWNVTRSTRPASTSWVDGSGCGFMRSLYHLLRRGARQSHGI